MIVDFAGCYIVERGCKALFAELEPAELVTRGKERREKRRLLQDAEKKEEMQNGMNGTLPELKELVKKTQ